MTRARNHFAIIEEIHVDELNDTYDQGYRHGFNEAIRVVRNEVEGKTYSRAVRSLLTRVKREFKATF